MKTIFDKWKVAALLLLAGVMPALSGDGQWVIHEWGTFTSLQDESGDAIPGINSDDEELPKFCHRLSDSHSILQSEGQPVLSKGLPSQNHPGVTMRLETPVLYFHPPANAPPVKGITVKATFRGGWLSEFYPNARVEAPGAFSFGAVRASTIGTLTWENLAVGGNLPGPVTDAHVWTSPRAVKAAAVLTTEGEREQFLFYRGVGHIDAPLRISRDEQTQELVLLSQLDSSMVGNRPLPVPSLWLVDIQPDGRLAFREVPPVTLDGRGRVLARVSSYFKLADYQAGNLEKLQASLRGSLLAQGLYGDEAQALLNTWELSYFKSPGLRVFFIVPRTWTDSYLPLDVSIPAEVDRVMVGRIELVTPGQRRLMQEIRQASTNRSQQIYLGLGRFRNALLLDEEARQPSPALAAFNASHFVRGGKPVEVSDAGSPFAVPAAVATTSKP